MGNFLLMSFVFLAAGVVAVPIAARLGLGSVFGYLTAGVLISPVLALLGIDVISLQHFAEFGVVMLLFLIGLEIKPEMIWKMRGRLLGLGGGQIALTTLAITCVAFAMGLSWQIALSIGLVLSLSSTAIVLQTLNEKSLLRSEGGQSSFLVLLTQDLAVIPMVALLPLLAIPELSDLAGHGGFEAVPAVEQGMDDLEDNTSLSLFGGLNEWQTALKTLGAIAFVIVVGNFLTAPMFRLIAVARLRELFTAAALMLVIGVSLLMSLVGLSLVLGTFLAGVVLANSEYRHELEAVIDPFRGLLLGLFFMTVGAGIDFSLLSSNFGVIGGLVLGLMLIKSLVLLVLAWIFKLEGEDKWLFALGLAQSGELGFVLLSFTVANNVIPVDIADQLLIVIALSMLSTPFLFYLVLRFSGQRVLGVEAWASELVVFLSYSRSDTEQMQEIAKTLENRGFTIKFDARDLPFGEKWQTELSYLIKQSDIVIWLASQNAINSRWCKWELGQVARFRKKLVPIIVGKILPDQLPRDVKKIQLLPAQGLFKASRRDHVTALVQLLGSDAAWIKDYSRLSARAHAWDKVLRNEDRLLSYAELIEAEAWQFERPPLAPEPMPLVLDYIHSSRIRANQSCSLSNSE